MALRQENWFRNYSITFTSYDAPLTRINLAESLWVIFCAYIRFAFQLNFMMIDSYWPWEVIGYPNWCLASSKWSSSSQADGACKWNNSSSGQSEEARPASLILLRKWPLTIESAYDIRMFIVFRYIYFGLDANLIWHYRIMNRSTEPISVVLIALYRYQNFPVRIMHSLLENIDGVQPYSIFKKFLYECN